MLVEDFDCYFDAWGVDATLAGIAVRGVFDTQTAGEYEVASEGPTFIVKPTTEVGPSVGQQLLLDGITYSVRQVLKVPPDGALLRLVLVRA